MILVSCVYILYCSYANECKLRKAHATSVLTAVMYFPFTSARGARGRGASRAVRGSARFAIGPCLVGVSITIWHGGVF